jgi:hypothetical protein
MGYLYQIKQDLAKKDLSKGEILAIKNRNMHVYLIMMSFITGLIIYNLSLPYPDCNDFYELSRICLLMDNNIKYCINSNWGFAHH